MGSVFTCKLNPCCGDLLNCTPPPQYYDNEPAAPASPAPALRIAVEALEQISNMHDGNPPDALADMPAAEYARQVISTMRREARSALAAIRARSGEVKP